MKRRRRNGVTFGFGLAPVVPVMYEPMTYVSFGADDPGADPGTAPPPGEADTVVLRRVDAGVRELVAAQKAEDERRKITFGLAIAGTLFAAVKLGFIVVPHFRSKTT